jgi:hypothetical protein
MIFSFAAPCRGTGDRYRPSVDNVRVSFQASLPGHVQGSYLHARGCSPVRSDFTLFRL